MSNIIQTKQQNIQYKSARINEIAKKQKNVMKRKNQSVYSKNEIFLFFFFDYLKNDICIIYKIYNWIKHY